MSVTLNYTSKDALKTILPPKLQAQLSNDTLGANSTDDAILLPVGKEAESIFESYVAGRDEYTLPIRDVNGQVPQIVITQINKVWRGMLFDRAGILDQYPSIDESYAEALKWMRDLAKGIVHIPMGSKDTDEKIYSGAIGITKKKPEVLTGFDA